MSHSLVGCFFPHLTLLTLVISIPAGVISAPGTVVLVQPSQHVTFFVTPVYLTGFVTVDGGAFSATVLCLLFLFTLLVVQ